VALTRAQKEERVERLVTSLEGCNGILLSSPQGLSVLELTDLRRRLTQASARHQVVKNTLLKLALERVGLSLSTQTLEGPTAVSFCQEDLVAPARVLAEYSREISDFSIKGGLLGDREIGRADVVTLANLPSRDVLLGQALGGMQAPLTSLMFVLQGNIQALLYALKARGEQLEEATT
jgi:large subunit ribosomal protein L10